MKNKHITHLYVYICTVQILNKFLHYLISTNDSLPLSFCPCQCFLPLPLLLLVAVASWFDQGQIEPLIVEHLTHDYTQGWYRVDKCDILLSFLHSFLLILQFSC